MNAKEQRTRNGCADVWTTACLEVMWRLSLDRCVDAAPLLLKNGFLIVAGHSGLVVALDSHSLEEARQVWRLRLPGRVEAAPTNCNCCGDHILVPCLDGQLCCLNAADGGCVLWSLDCGTGQPLRGSVSCAIYLLGHCFVASHSGILRCVRIADGHVMWQVTVDSSGLVATPLPLVSAPGASCNESLVVASLGGALTRLSCSEDDAQILWRAHLGAPLFSSPVQLGARMTELQQWYWVVSTVVCIVFEVDDGAPRWRVATGAPIFCTPRLLFNGHQVKSLEFLKLKFCDIICF